MSKLKPNELKNTDILWIPKTAQHWEVIRGKFIFKSEKIINDKMQCKDRLALTLKGVIDRFEGDNIGLNPNDLRTYQIFNSGDLVFKLIDLDNKKTSRVGYVHKKGIMSSAYIRIISNSSMNMRYFYYQYFDLYQRYIFNDIGQGVRATMSSKDLLNIPILVPPLAEQNAIVAYLDAKTQQIQDFITKKQKLIQLLEEKLAIFISDSVSKHQSDWTIKKIKYTSKIFRGKFTHRPRNDESLYNGKYPFIQTGDVARANKYIKEYTQTLNEKGYKVTTKFPKDTVVMTIAANIGDVAILGFDACFPDSVIGFYPQKEMLNDFLFYSLKSKKDFFLSIAVVNTQMNLNVERVGNIEIKVPPYSEQKNIVEKILIFEDKITQAITQAQKEIEKLKEYQESLITQVVTGQLQVPMA
ncbi:restriction endonuclease subunit S [Capnocytophaga sp. ARDL2]|uniref:restriction endonuclease subunit S n=1 Tax=Capnocytophaga sp. ARDL2 TaxID=3238809 RepID=UPI003557B5CF